MKLTENDVLALLRARHERPGNGGSGEYAFLTHVRDAAGFDAGRTFDAVAVSLWPSRGLLLDVFEIKVSRGDWTRELVKPEKAESACRLADRFWVVAPEGVVRDGELPATWGLMEVAERKVGARLETRVHAPLLHELVAGRKYRPLPRSFVVGMLRACPGAIPGGKLDPDVRAMQAAKREGQLEAEKLMAGEMKRLRERIGELDAVIKAFEREAGVSLSKWKYRHPSEPPDVATVEHVARTLRSVLDGGELIDMAHNKLLQTARMLREHADVLDKAGGNR